MDNEQFFENLASGKAKSMETTPAEATDMGDYEVELAKAETSAVASRGVKTARGAKNETRDDDGVAEGQLTIDVYQTPEDIIVESAIAGVKPEDIDVNVTSDSISIRGERHHETDVQEDDYLYQECYWGRFARSIILPQEIDPENADVAFKNGILTIRLPKVNKKKSKKLSVRID